MRNVVEERARRHKAARTDADRRRWAAWTPEQCRDQRRYKLEGMLAEWAFFNWTGMVGHQRPVAGKLQDGGDVPGDGQVKAAPNICEYPGRHSQNWTVPAEYHLRVQWFVFIAIELSRDTGPANARLVDAVKRHPSIALWIREGRWKEPVASLCGWLPASAVEKIDTQKNIDDGMGRVHKNYRLVPMSMLHPWPEHPRPISAVALRELLQVEPQEEERQGFLDGMKRSLIDAGPE